MAYLHHRLLQCPYENDLLAKARQLGRQRGRPAAHTAPHKVMPLQVCLSSCPYSLMLLAPIRPALFPPPPFPIEGLLKGPPFYVDPGAGCNAYVSCYLLLDLFGVQPGL